MSHQEIDILTVDRDSTGKKTQSQLFMINRLSCLLDRTDGFEILLLGFINSSLAIPYLCEASLDFPLDPCLNVGLSKNLVQKLFSFFELLFGNGDMAGQK